MVTTSRLGKLQRKMRDDIFSLFTTSESKSQFRGLWKRRRKRLQQPTLSHSFLALHISLCDKPSLAVPAQTTPLKSRPSPRGSNVTDVQAPTYLLIVPLPAALGKEGGAGHEGAPEPINPGLPERARGSAAVPTAAHTVKGSPGWARLPFSKLGEGLELQPEISAPQTSRDAHIKYKLTEGEFSD